MHYRMLRFPRDHRVLWVLHALLAFDEGYTVQHIPYLDSSISYLMAFQYV